VAPTDKKLTVLYSFTSFSIMLSSDDNVIIPEKRYSNIVVFDCAILMDDDAENR